MTQLAHIHDYRMTALDHGEDGTWREKQACVKCPWAVRWLKLPVTPEDERYKHRAPCWCPQCMRGRR